MAQSLKDCYLFSSVLTKFAQSACDSLFVLLVFQLVFSGRFQLLNFFSREIFHTSKPTPMSVLSAEFSTSRQAVTAKPAELNNKLVARGD